LLPPHIAWPPVAVAPVVSQRPGGRDHLLTITPPDLRDGALGIPPMPTWAMISVIVGWSVIGAWRMITRDA